MPGRRGAKHADFEENPPDKFKVIHIMRTVRGFGFDPCLPRGVHVYLDKGAILKKIHSSTMLNSV